jgi:hypothetical protein
MKRLLTAVLFLGALAAFFLPFVRLSPDVPPEVVEEAGIPVGVTATLSGVDLVRAGATAADRPNPNEILREAARGLLFGGEETVDAQFWAIGAVAAGAVGLLLTLRQWRIGGILAILLGAAGAGLLLLAKAEIGRRAIIAGGFGLRLSYLYGFWTSIGLFAGTAASGLYRLGADRAPR